MKLKTGDEIVVIFDDPALTGITTKAILLGKDKGCYAVLTSENTIGYIDKTNVQKNCGTTSESTEKAISILNKRKELQAI